MAMFRRALAAHKATAGVLSHQQRAGPPPGQVYDGGQPWLLYTLAAAQILYQAVYFWERAGYGHVAEVGKTLPDSPGAGCSYLESWGVRDGSEAGARVYE